MHKKMFESQLVEKFNISHHHLANTTQRKDNISAQND